MQLPRNRRFLILFLAALLALAVAASLAISRKPKESPAIKAPLVSITRARLVDIPLEFAAQGHVVSLNFVDIRPQLTGTVLTVNFHEGDQVKPGQLLFTLDDADARAQLAKAEAQGALVGAQLADARREFQRAQALVASKFIAVSVADTASSKVDALQAQVRSAGAEASSARTTLTRTRIVAPIAGVAGAVTVHQGSLAQSGSAAPLVTIAQFSPVGVEFSLPEQDLPMVLAARAVGPVEVSVDSPAGGKLAGQLTFINNTINQDSATINLKASFQNSPQSLWPGGFTRVVLHAGASKGAVVLPPQAVQEGPGGRFVFLLRPDSTVAAQPVELVRVQNGVAIVRGLQGGEQLVLEGGQNLKSGAKVQLSRVAP